MRTAGREEVDVKIAANDEMIGRESASQRADFAKEVVEVPEVESYCIRRGLYLINNLSL